MCKSVDDFRVYRVMCIKVPVDGVSLDIGVSIEFCEHD